MRVDHRCVLRPSGALNGLAPRALLLACLTFAGGSAAAQERAFDFALIGDMPYTKVQEREYQRVLGALNAADLAFVAHIGDFQFDARPYNQNPTIASMPCVDENYKAIYASFQTIRHPFVLTPGDNDWTDCWPLQAQKVDPLELLAKVRTMFFPEGRSLGQRPIAVKNQSADPQFAKFRENLRWSIGGVTFVTLHIVGSNDNFGRTPEMDAEHLERKAANIAWMKQAFAEAKAANSRGLVILTQANPGFENFWPPAAKTRYFIPFIPRGQALPNPDHRVRRLHPNPRGRIGGFRQAGRLPPRRHPPIPHRQAALQQEDEPAVRELHARRDVRLARHALGPHYCRSCRPAALPFQGGNCAGKRGQPAKLMGTDTCWKGQLDRIAHSRAARRLTGQVRP